MSSPKFSSAPLLSVSTGLRKPLLRDAGVGGSPWLPAGPPTACATGALLEMGDAAGVRWNISSWQHVNAGTFPLQGELVPPQLHLQRARYGCAVARPFRVSRDHETAAPRGPHVSATPRPSLPRRAERAYRAGPLARVWAARP